MKIVAFWAIVMMGAMLHLKDAAAEGGSVRVSRGPPQPSQSIISSSVIELASKSPNGRTATTGYALPMVSYGQNAALGDFPYIGIMSMTFGPDPSGGGMYGARCGCTLIAPRVAMTAAHCLNGDYLGEVRIAFNVIDASTALKTSTPFYAEQVIIHPDFNPVTMENDIALIGLDRASTVPPVVLSTLTTSQIPTRLAVAGWGRTEIEYLNGNTSVSNELIYAWVPYVPYSDCIKAFNAWDMEPPASTAICAGGEKSDTCQGDSGGPLAIPAGRWPYDGFTQNIQVGITSDGPVPCGGTEFIGAYTDVSIFTTWIQDTIVYNNLEGATDPAVSNINVLYGNCTSMASQVLSSSTTQSGGECSMKCKQESACGLWSYSEVTSLCKIFSYTGFYLIPGNCTTGYVDRPDMPSGATVAAGFRKYTGQTILNKTITVTTLEACATECENEPTCYFFMYSGPPGSTSTLNSNGNNCWLVDSRATATAAGSYVASAHGNIKRGKSPSPSRPPPPPPPVVRKACKLNGSYHFIANGRSKCTSRKEYLGYRGGSAAKCMSTSVIVDTETAYAQWRISTDASGVAMFTTIGSKCVSGERRLTSSSTTSSNIRPYLSKSGTQWQIYPVKGNDCSLVNIVSKKRSSEGYNAYLSAPYACREHGTRLSSRDSGSGRQRWTVKRVP